VASADHCERTSTLDEASAKHAQVIEVEHVYQGWVSPAWLS